MKPKSEPIDPLVVPPKETGNRWLVIGVASFLTAFVFAAFVWVYFPNAQSLISQTIRPTVAPISHPPAGEPTPEPGLSIALMGRGGAGHDGGALTDTILIARVLETQKRIVLLSIPRDLWVSIPDTEKYASTSAKINFAYAAGGGKLAKETFAQVTGITVDKFVTIDFSGFEQAVDSIGGIDIDVDRAFQDYEYPIAGRENLDCTTYTPVPLDPKPQDISEADLIASGKLDASILPELPKMYPCRYELLDVTSGMQHMDGKRVLKYVRSRHSSQDGNDFARSRRQRLVLEATATKLFSLNAFTKIPTFLTTLRSHVDTDIATTEILSLVPHMSELRTYPVTNLALSTDNYLGQGYTADHQFALTPIQGEGNYVSIKDWVSTALTPGKKLAYPTIEVTSFWKDATASATLVNQLVAKGYPAKVGPLVMKNGTTSATLLYTNPNIAPQSLKQIQETASVRETFVQFASPSAKLDTKADIMIMLP